MNSNELLDEVQTRPESIAEIFAELENQNDHPPLIIRLTDVSESDWIKEGTDGPGQIPERMAFPGLYRIFPSCQIAIFQDDDKKKYKLFNIRYIAGCPSLDPKYQDENGYVPNLDGDNIWVKNGTETFLRIGSDAAKYDYIKLYQGNVNNPHRPPTAEDEFEEIIEKEVAATQNVEFQTRRQAMNLVGELSKELPGGKGFEYDMERLKLFSNIFGLNSLESPEEKFQALGALAETDPERIINSVVNHKKAIFATVSQAEELGVIAFDADKVFFLNNNAVILPFRTKLSKTSQVNTLVDHLLTESGEVYLQQIKIQSQEQAKETLSTN